MTPFTKVYGKDLKVGDVIAPWGGRTARITELKLYTGPHAHLWGGKAQIARLTSTAPGQFVAQSMTIDPWQAYDVRRPAPACERYSPHPLDHLEER